MILELKARQTFQLIFKVVLIECIEKNNEADCYKILSKRLSI